MDIQYIYHSCFVVTEETQKTALIFDYYKGELPKFSKDYTIVFLVSHKHFDHFTKAIFNYALDYEKCVFVLSNDMKMNEKYMDRCKVPVLARDKIIYAKPWDCFDVADGVKVETIKSSDAGVAYMVDFFGNNIYHSGDHNYWIWDEDSAQGEVKKKYMQRMFFGELKKLGGRHFDVAFFPLDARLGDHFHEGFDAFMKTCDVDIVYPMHMWDDTSAVQRLKEMECSEPYREKIYG